MFNTISHLLPSGLTSAFHTQPEQAPDSHLQPTAPDDAQVTLRPRSASVEPPRSRRERKEKQAYETFIIVRPPPAKTNHPLNLQVQLVPPTPAAQKPQTPSGDAWRTNDVENGSPRNPPSLGRTMSIRSTASGPAGPSTPSTSMSSLATNTSTSSPRRTIIPLYNLQAHNVLTNVIVDAGTDSKVAKFSKKGIEVVGLAVLEPIEHCSNPTAHLPSASPRPSVEGMRDESVASHGRSESVLSHHDLSPVPESFTPMKQSFLALPSSTANSKLFSKMFRKSGTPKSNSRPSSMIIDTPEDEVTPTKSGIRSVLGFSRHGRTGSIVSITQVPASPSLTSIEDRGATALAAASPSITTFALAPVLGVQPTSSAHVGRGRPTAYIWVVRRWIKGEDSLLAGMVGRITAASGGVGVASTHHNGHGATPVEVCFEWTRGFKPVKRNIQRPISNRSSREHLSANEHSPPRNANNSLKNKQRRRSSMLTTSTHTNSDEDTNASHAAPSDAGDDSDPEDTETPWTCSVTIQQVVTQIHARLPSLFPNHSYTTTSSSSSPSSPSLPSLRLKVASLCPTPHHPKVISMLKMPFPLPDIEVDTMIVRKRTVSPQGHTIPTPMPGMSLVLSAEEIKDVVSCTALWVVVREGFGGVGKSTRKGDGWAIRK